MRLSLGVALSFLCTLSWAADPAHAVIRKDTQIPAGGLGVALQSLAKQFDFQVLYPTQIVKDLKTSGASGSLTADEALTKVLANTGLAYKYLDPSTVTVFSSSSAPSSPAAGQDPTQSNSDQKETGKKPSQDFRVAQATPGETQGNVSVEQQEEETARKKPFIQEVVVTGSRIPTSAGQQVVPVRSYTQEDIERSGQTTVADYLNTLPDVSTATTAAFQSAIPGMTTVQLHGLPVGTTLTLINGRRVETSVYGFFDLSSIPAAAVERIDVLPVGASAIYGADALGGAVNIVTRRNFDGVEVNGTYSHLTGASDASGNIGWGKSWGRGSIMLLGTYQDTGELLGQERGVTSGITFPVGAPTFYVGDDCSPGNVYSLNGQDLPGLNSPVAGIPQGVSGRPTVQQFAATAGKVNLCNLYRNAALVDSVQRQGALLSGHYEFSESLDLFTEILASHLNVRAPAGALIDAMGGAFGAVTVGASNPYNPFGESVGISFASDALLREYRTSEDLLRPLLGARGALFSDWTYEVTAYVSHDRLIVDTPAFADPTALQAALNSSDTASALNPFTIGAPGSPQLLESLTTGSASTYHFDNQIADAQGILRGSLARLPAGPLNAVLGAEYSRQEQNTELPPTTLDLSRRAYALFSEMRLPILGDLGQQQGKSGIVLTAAGRYDHTNDFGGKATFQAGLLWKPSAKLSFSAGYGTSYRAPQLLEIQGPQQIIFGDTGVTDPLRGNERVIANLTFGSNPNLKPETGISRTVAVVYADEPEGHLRASISYYSINISNYIAAPSLEAIIDNPSLFPGAVVRSPPTPQDVARGYPGQITSVSDIYFNFGALNVSGVDADVSYGISTGVGRFTPSVALSNIYRWEVGLTPQAPLISYVSRASGFSGVGWAPRWKGSVGLEWMRESLSASLSGRYTGRYRDYQDITPNSNELGNWWVLDASVRYELGKTTAGANSWLRGAYLSVGAIDLLNRAPPFSYGSAPYDPAIYDIRGRILRVQVGAKW